MDVASTTWSRKSRTAVCRANQYAKVSLQGILIHTRVLARKRWNLQSTRKHFSMDWEPVVVWSWRKNFLISCSHMSMLESQLLTFQPQLHSFLNRATCSVFLVFFFYWQWIEKISRKDSHRGWICWRTSALTWSHRTASQLTHKTA